MSEKPKTRSSKVFLCHSHHDKPFVRRLANDLSALGVDVWLDEWELKPGDSLHEAIGLAIRASAHIGIVLSPHSVASRWCRNELSQAMSQEAAANRNLAIPLLYRRVEPPPFLMDRLLADFSKHYFVALTQLAAFVHGLPSRAIATALSLSKPRTIDEACSALESAGWKGMHYLSFEEYKTLRRLLNKAGVPIRGDVLEVSPTAEELKLSLRRPLPAKTASATKTRKVVRKPLKARYRVAA